MRSLKPIESKTTATLIASDIADDLRAQIAVLQSAIDTLSGNVDDLEAQISCQNTTKESGTFSSVSAANGNFTNASITNLDAHSACIDTVETDSIQAGNINATTLSAGTSNADHATISCLCADAATFNEVAATCFSSDEVQTPQVTAERVSANEIVAPSASISDLSVQTLNTPQTINANEINVEQLDADTINTPEAIIDEITAKVAKLDELYNKNKAFTIDENDVHEYVLLGEPNDGPAGNDDPKYIEFPTITNGLYRITVKKADNNKYFNVTLLNSGSTPVVIYDKENSGDIDQIYYDSVNNRLYIKTFAYGKIFYCNDSKSLTLAPKTYAELPFDSSAVTTFRYAASAKSRVVVMGDYSMDYGFAIQGVLEATIIKESAQFHQLFFYGDSWAGLKNFAEKFLVYEDHNHVKHYTHSETSGYLMHYDVDTDESVDSYKDAYGTDTEALEKISYDGTTVALTVDGKYGQDEITIDDAGIASGYTVTLPAGLYPYIEDDVRYICYTLPAGTYDGCEIPSDVEVKFEYGQTAVLHEPIPETDYTLEIIPGGAGPSDVINIIDSTQTVLADVSHDVQIWWLDNVLSDTEVSIGENEQKTTQIGIFDYVVETTNGSLTSAYLTSPLGNIDVTSVSTIEPSSTTVPMPDKLPFVLSFTTGGYSWDKTMNDTVWNSWGSERG